MEEGNTENVAVLGQTGSPEWLKTLPYDTNESDSLIEDILSIAREILLRDASSTIIVAAFVNKINRRDIENFHIEQLSITCKKLVKIKNPSLEGILVLDWRPLYDKIEPIILDKDKEALTGKYSIKNFFNLIYSLKKFFPPEATLEILDEMLPQINVHNFAFSVSISIVLRQFLPTNKPPPLPNLLPKDIPQFYWVPTIFSICSLFSNSLTYPQIFMYLLASLAKSQVHSPKNCGFTNNNISYIFTMGLRCLQLPIGSDISGKTSETSNYGIHVGASVSPLAQYPLPGVGNAAVDFLDKKKMISPFAKFIVYSLFENSSNSSDLQQGKLTESQLAIGDLDLPQYHTIYMLEKFMQAINMYFYPSNHGTWSISMSKLVSCLAFNFLTRIRLEQSPNCKIPECYKLTPSLKKRFIDLLLPILQICLLSRSQTIISGVAQAIKNLLWADPESTTPVFLKTIEDNLDMYNNEPHVICNCYRVLAQIIYPILRINDASIWSHSISRFLESAIWAVEVNDNIRANTALSFISSFAMCMPLYNTSKISTENPSQLSTSAIDFTTFFETWVLEYIEKLFILIKNLLVVDDINSKKSSDTGLLYLALTVLETIMQQCSPTIEKLAVQKMLKYTLTPIPNAEKSITIFCASVDNPEVRLASFLERSSRIILNELDSGAAQNIDRNTINESNIPYIISSMSDANFYWHQSIFMHVILFSGPTILKYRELVKSILIATITKTKSRPGHCTAAKTLWAVVSNLVSVYPNNTRSSPPNVWSDEKFSASAHEYRGINYNIEEANIDWCIPTDEGIRYAVELLELFFDMSIKNIESWMLKFSLEVESVLSVEKWMKLLSECVNSAFLMIKSLNSAHETLSSNYSDLVDDIEFSKSGFVNVKTYLEETDPRYTLLKNYIDKCADLICKVSQKIYSKNVNNFNLLNRLVKTLSAFINNKSINPNVCSMLMNMYHYKKMEVTEAHNEKRLLRHLIAKRAHNLHIYRIMHNTCQRKLGPLEKNIFRELFNWSRCRYSRVRIQSQSSFKMSLWIFDLELGNIICEDVIKFFRDVISKMSLAQKKKDCYTQANSLNTNTHESSHAVFSNPQTGFRSQEELDSLTCEIKGVLYLLKGDFITSFNYVHWDKKFEVIVALIKLYNSELGQKIKILCYDVITEYLQKISWVGAYNKWTFYTLCNNLPRRNEKLHEQLISSEFFLKDYVNSKRLEISRNTSQHLHDHPCGKKYQDSIENILKLIDYPNSNWTLVTLGTKLLFQFIKTDEKIPVKLTSYAMSMVQSDLKTNRFVGLQLLVKIIAVLRYTEKNNSNNSKREISHQTKELVNECFDFEKLKTKPLKDVSFHDNTRVGWLCWPKKYSVRYGGGCQNNSKQLLEDESYIFLDEKLLDKFFWTNLITFFSEESENNEGKTSDKLLVLFFRYYFAIYKTRHLKVIHEIIVDQLFHSRESSKQRLLSQIVGGMIRGSKHWDEVSLDNMWKLVMPFIENGVYNSGRESFGHWVEYCVLFPLKNRDPRRVAPIIDMIVNEEVVMKPQIALLEVQKLTAVKLLFLSECSWRLVSFRQGLLNKCVDQLKSTYDIMCECVGSNINAILQVKFCPQYTNVISLINDNFTLQEHISKGCDLSSTINEYKHPINFFNSDEDSLDILKKILDYLKLAREFDNDNETRNEGEFDYQKICRVFCSWIYDGISYYSGIGFVPILHRIISPLLLMLSHCDIKLQDTVNKLANSYPYVYHSPHILDKCLNIFLQALSEDYLDGIFIKDMWQLRLKILPILQVFIFNHMFVLSQKDIDRTADIVVRLLEDSHMEVRSLAAVTFTGIIVCFYQEKVTLFVNKFKYTLENFRLPHRYNVCETKEELNRVPQDLILKVHGAILGLCAIVSANPYNIKPWTADILSTLSRYINERSPISTSVNKLFGDFRHTHQNTWEEDMKSFNEEDCAKINEALCSQSYYA